MVRISIYLYGIFFSLSDIDYLLTLYPDQDQEERFIFTRTEEPAFEKVSNYVHFYKLGIRWSVISV